MKMEETYVQEAIVLLRRKRFLQAAKEALQQQLRILETEIQACMTALQTAETATDPVKDPIRIRLEKLEWRSQETAYRLHMAEGELEQIHRAYALLSPYQRDLLDTFFASGEKNCAERLSSRYYKERSAVYRDRKKALNAFTLAVFGDIPC